MQLFAHLLSRKLMEYKHYWTFKNIGSSYIKEQELIKEKFSSYQVNEFSA